MKSSGIVKTKNLKIKNMISHCCLVLIREKFEQAGITVNDIKLGSVTITYDTGNYSLKSISDLLANYGFEIIHDREKQLVEQIKQTVIELIHLMNNVDSIARKSEYMVEKLGLSFQYLSKIFSAHEPITLERFIILHKIERTKELIDSNEYTLSEIAFMMDYSSVQHLSTQFKTIAGISVTEYKQSENKDKKGIDII